MEKQERILNDCVTHIEKALDLRVAKAIRAILIAIFEEGIHGRNYDEAPDSSESSK